MKESTNNDNALGDFLQEVLEAFKVYPKGYAVARCPFHDDEHPSLFVDPGTGRFHCKACGEVGGLVKLTAQAKGLKIEEAEELLKSLGILNNRKLRKIEGEYFYWKEDGSLAFKVIRYSLPNGAKTFAVYHYDYDREKWISGKGEEEEVLYNLGDVLSADTVLVVEGEKCVEAVKKFGFVATTNPFGAGKWKPEYAKWLKEKTVYLLPDNDDTGISHMKEVGDSLRGQAKAIYWVDLSPHVGPKGDIADLIEAWGQEGISEEEIKAKIENLLKEADPYDPDRFSILNKLSLTPDTLENFKTEFLIDDFIPKNAMVLITAKFGGGKSLSALALSKLLIEKGYKVLYLDLDNSISVVKERLSQAKLMKFLGKSFLYITRSMHALHSKSRMWKEVKKELRNRDEHFIVIVDTLKNFSKGMELNSDKEMNEVMSELMDIREAGHTVLILHHLPKKVDEDNPYKNNTTVVDAVDVAYRLRKNESRLVFENFKDRIPVKKTITFEIDGEFNLRETVPPKVEEERTIAQVVLKLIPPEGRKQGDLIVAVSDHLKANYEEIPYGKNRIKEVLEKYEGRFWEVIRADNNAKVYKRLIVPTEVDSLFAGLPTHIYREENRQTQESQGLENNSGVEVAGKPNGDNGLGEPTELWELLQEI